MLYIVPDEELPKLCYYLTQQTYIYYPVVKEYWQDLYNTGCRPMELLTPSLWSEIAADLFQLTPLKGNSVRTFDGALLSNSLRQAIQYGIDPYDSLSLRQLTSVTKKVLPVPRIQTIEKSSIDYLFRYNYIKVLKSQGLSDAAIQTEMGWSSPLLAASYYNAVMYTTAPLPPLPPIPSLMQLLYVNTDDIYSVAGTTVNAYNYTVPANKLNQDGATLEVIMQFMQVGAFSSGSAQFQVASSNFGLSMQNFFEGHFLKICITRKSATVWRVTFVEAYGWSNYIYSFSSDIPADATSTHLIRLGLTANTSNSIAAKYCSIKFFSAP